VFDDERPGRIQMGIWLAASDTKRLACARCREEVFRRDIAIFSRTRPGDPFDPWCYTCAHQLVRWAGTGALATHSVDSPEHVQRLKGLLHRGDW
jgi:hypothetical protein